MTKSGKVHKQDTATLKGNIKRRLGSHTKPGHLPEENLSEKHLTSAETSKKEEIVKSMKKGLAGFKERYGKRAKSVMYATATKQAKKIAEKLEFDPSTETPKNN